MDEEVTTSFWISFFVEAGIPPAAAANYAIIFTDNRIQKHMLLDLNKEYLKDMGVNVLGDIIAILKHSKRYHEKVAREKVLACDKEISVMKATKHLNEMLLKEESPKAAPVAVQSPVVAQTRSAPSPPKKMKIVQSDAARLLNDVEWIEQVEELKRKVIAPSKITKTIIPNPPAAVKTVKKTSVFDRLGESNVTSTTPELPAAPSTSNMTQQSSVFRRLGGVTEANSPPAVKTVAQISKPTQVVVKKTHIVSRTRSSEASDSGKKPLLRMDIESAAAKTSARARLGLDRPQSTKIGVVSSKLTTNPMRTIISPHEEKRATSGNKSRTTGVKERLGSSSKTSSGGVFNRLGGGRK